MSRPTHQQLEALADFLTANPGIAKGVLRTANGKQITKRKWDELANSINALGGAVKDGKGWAKYWADKKCALKKLCSQHALSMRRTGGGPADENMSVLTPIDQRLVAVMGGLQFAAGDSHVSLNPFPSTSQIQSQNVELEFVLQDNVNIVSQDNVNIVSQDNINIIEVPASPVQTVRVHTPPPSTSTRRQTRAGRRNLVEHSHQQFAEIERQRVEAENISARALTETVQQITRLSTSIDGLTLATREAAQTVAEALQGLNKIADALQGLNKIADALKK